VNTGTIVIRKETREHLKEIGRKNQTYDQLINELIEWNKGKYKDSPRLKESISSNLGVGTGL
jgi:predicted CopG family antitoxin